MPDITRMSYLIFDLGGVLIEWDPRHLYRKLFNGQHEEMEFFLANICSPAWNRQMDLGRPFKEAVTELAGDHPHYAELIYAYHSRWEEMVPHAIEDSIHIVQDLRNAGYRLGALSNWSHETFPLMRNRFSFLEWFDPLIISGEVKVAKPSEAIFRKFLSHSGQEAGNCLFIDDSLPNIESAQQLGFQTILFHSASNLRSELEACGLL